MTGPKGFPNNFALGSLRTTASHTIGIPHLVELLKVVPASAPTDDYRAAVIEENVLGRPTQAGRARSFRHLRELYILDPVRPEFSALRKVWSVDPLAQPLLAGLLAFTRDEMLRASFSAIAASKPGDLVTSGDLTQAVANTYGNAVGETTLGKIGRNTGACWTQTGHLEGRAKKIRRRVVARPAAVAYAAYLGHLQGARALDVLNTEWSPLLELATDARLGSLRDAHREGLVDLLVAGDVVDVGFSFFEGVRQ